MSQHTPSASVVEPARIASLYQSRALRLLLEAWDAAQEVGQDVWQFAVEIGQLRGVGLSHTDIRLLLCRGYVEHAQERPGQVAGPRAFHRLSNLTLPKRACFVLTAKGLALAAGPVVQATFGEGTVANRSKTPPPLAEVPRWDRGARELWYRNVLVKQFRVPAGNQEVVLTALEEEGWPNRIDDPLPPALDIEPKARLHDTIKALNRHHLRRIIRFAGDGSGRGIRWIVAERP